MLTNDCSGEPGGEVGGGLRRPPLSESTDRRCCVYGQLEPTVGGRRPGKRRVQPDRPWTPEGEAGLVAGPGGSLLTLTTSGNLTSINPSTGIATVIGATGLGDCSGSSSLCGPQSANSLAGLAGKLYATAFTNKLYTLNPVTGATLVGPTGVAGVPAVPFSINPDGSTNLFDKSLFSTGGVLYATFDAITLASDDFTMNPVIAAKLYEIDPVTGLATLLAPTKLQILSAVDVSGTVYAFHGTFDPAGFFQGMSDLETLDVTNGSTTTVRNIDPAAGPIFGASPTPTPPASLALVGSGLLAIAARWRKSRLG